MAETEMIRVHVEQELKRRAEESLHALGLSADEAITLFYQQVAVRKGLPFDADVPNAETVEALRQVEAGSDLIEYATLDELRSGV